MSKLLRADLRRLFRSKLFWVSSVFMLLLGLLPIKDWLSNKEAIAEGFTDGLYHLDDSFFTYALVLFIIITIMTALFIGAEYAGGTIRNKIIVGHRRPHIYLSNLITLTVAVVIWIAIYLAVALSVGIPLLGMFEFGLPCALRYMLLSLTLSVTLTAIMLAISMLCRNRTYSAIICLMLTFAMLFAGVMISSTLREPEYFEGYMYMNTDTGEIDREDRMPNPNYVSGTKRLVLEEVYDILPGCQMIQICGLSVEHPTKFIGYDLLLFALSTFIGILFWKRKDLK